MIGRAGIGVDNVDVPGRHQARHHRRERAAVQHHHGRGAHAGAAARAGAQRAAGARVADRRRVGALRVQRRGALREDARHARLRPDRPARGAAGARLRHARGRLRRRTSPRSASASSAWSAPSPPRTLYARADFITVHLPVTPETENWLDADAFAAMKDGVRVINVARGKLMDEEALREALDSGKVAGAALDVFREEPVTEHPLFDYPNVVVTPHLGASTAEATDRAGYQAAEQVVAALTGGVVTNAVNVPPSRRGPRGAGPVPAARARPRPDRELARRAHVGGRGRGRVPRPHRRARHAPADRAGPEAACSRATSRRRSTR